LKKRCVNAGLSDETIERWLERMMAVTSVRG
jgi:hypothetical protein